MFLTVPYDSSYSLCPTQQLFTYHWDLVNRSSYFSSKRSADRRNGTDGEDGTDGKDGRDGEDGTYIKDGTG